MYTYTRVIVGAAHIIGHERRILMNVTPDLLLQQHISAPSFSLSLLLCLCGLETRASLHASLVNHIVPCLPYTPHHKNPVLGAPRISTCFVQTRKNRFKVKKILLLRGKENKDRRCVGGWM